MDSVVKMDDVSSGAGAGAGTGAGTDIGTIGSEMTAANLATLNQILIIYQKSGYKEAFKLFVEKYTDPKNK